MPLRLIWHFWNLFNLVNYRLLKKIIANEQIDIIISHNLMGIGFLVARAIKGFKRPWIHTLHDIQLLHPLGLMFYGQENKIKCWPVKIYRFINKKLMGSPTLVISPSQWLMDMHKNFGFFKKSKLAVCLNPSVATRQKEIKEKNTFTILYVGQLEQHKGVDILIDVFLDMDLPSATKLKIIGDGNLLEDIKKKIKNSKKIGAIELLGRQPAKTVLNFMSRAQLLVAPSLCYENSPTVIYEAAANDLPVLASDIGGAGELTRAVGGITFKPGDKKDLSEKLKFCLDNYETLKNNLHPEAILNTDYMKNILELLKTNKQ